MPYPIQLPGADNQTNNLQKTAFGELSTAQNTPLIQMTAQYGLLDDVLTAAIGGTTTAANSNFVVSTGVGANNVAAIVSSREAQYKAGQGLLARFTALFTSGVENSTQQAGFLNSESAFAFGFDGSEFGILHARDGVLENQELTISTSASFSEDASVTVDGNVYTISLSNGSTQDNAYEISAYLNINVPGYSFTSVDNTVYCLAQLPDFGVGVFAFSSATAEGVWVQIQDGTIPTEVWVKKSEWNVRPNIEIDQTKGNVFQIQIQYLGYGGVRFYIENPLTADFEMVHVIRYANTSVIPSVSNPIFRVGWAARNTGNTTDIQVKGASAAVFVEGAIKYDGRPKSVCTTRSGVGNPQVNILAFRNRLTFNNSSNRAEIIPILASMVSDANRTTFFEILQEPVVDGTLIFERFKPDSLLEISTTDVGILSGEVVACFTASQKRPIEADLSLFLEYISPGVTYSITARNAGGGNDIDVSLTIKEDL